MVRIAFPGELLLNSDVGESSLELAKRLVIRNYAAGSET
jgi:hypothetical protein